MDPNRTEYPKSGGECASESSRRASRGSLWADRQLGGLLLRLHGARDIPQFWTALQALLSAAVPYDAMVVYLNFYDFARSWKAAKILATPNAQRPTLWFEGRRRVDMTPDYVLAQPNRLKLYRLSDVIPDERRLNNTPFFREYFAAHGWRHVAVSLYWRGGTVCSEIALRRTKEQGDFTRSDVRRLEELYPHIDTVIGRLLSLEEERARRSWFESFNEHLPFALMFLDWELEPVFVNQAAFKVCAAWNHGPEKARAYHVRSVFALPPEIRQACQALRTRWVERAANAGEEAVLSDSVRALHPSRAGLTASVTMQADERHPMAHPGFLVHLTDRGTGEATRPAMAHPLLLRLSPAERELARQVCAGLGNAEIATRLGKSVATVKKQLTSIYAKTGVDGRSRFLAVVAGG